MNYKPTNRTGNTQKASTERRISLSALGKELVTIVRHPIRYNAAIRGVRQLVKMFPELAQVSAFYDVAGQKTDVSMKTTDEPDAITYEESSSRSVAEQSNVVSLSDFRTDRQNSIEPASDSKEIVAARQRIAQLLMSEGGDDAQEAA